MTDPAVTARTPEGREAASPERERLDPVVEWVDRQMNTPWPEGKSEDFRRGYDTAVEEVSGLLEYRERTLAPKPAGSAALLREALTDIIGIATNERDYWPVTAVSEIERRARAALQVAAPPSAPDGGLDVARLAQGLYEALSATYPQNYFDWHPQTAWDELTPAVAAEWTRDAERLAQRYRAALSQNGEPSREEREL